MQGLREVLVGSAFGRGLFWERALRGPGVLRSRPGSGACAHGPHAAADPRKAAIPPLGPGGEGRLSRVMATVHDVPCLPTPPFPLPPHPTATRRSPPPPTRLGCWRR